MGRVKFAFMSFFIIIYGCGDDIEEYPVSAEGEQGLQPTCKT